MKFRKIVNFIYTYSVAIRFVLVGTIMFAIEFLNMLNHNVATFENSITTTDDILMCFVSVISFMDFIINNRKKEASYWCLLLSINTFFISIYLSLQARYVSRIAITIAFFACLVSFVFSHTVKNRKDYNFLAISYLIIIAAWFLHCKPWLLISD